ncbi:MAG: glycine betaine ABC transporter substrate-binding protein, partial [Nitriliruptorales bacterium]|nr:glycine betaine ABC transporter substrate-binding protein [Nitriliruptorales bacterium]
CQNNLGDGPDQPVTDLGAIYEDSTQGWYVPRYVVEGEDAPAPDLTSVSQLDQYADVFEDPANPGKGRLIAGVTGWAITKDNQVKLSAYGLQESYTAQTVGSQAAVDSAIVGAIQQQDPILTYYYTPTWILGKYDMVKLEEPKWTEECEQARDQAKQQGSPPYPGVSGQAGCAFKTTDIHVGANDGFVEEFPEAASFLEAMDVGLDPIAEAAAYMKSESVSPQEAAVRYLEQHPDRWEQWVDDDTAEKITAALESQGDEPTSFGAWLTDFPSTVIPLEQWASDGVNAFVDATGSFFGTISDGLTFAVAQVQQFLLWLPWVIIVAVFAALGWWVGDWKLAAGTAAGFALLGLLGVWDESMRTLALIIFATVISVGIGIPTGIAMARNSALETVVRPVLDFMQTMPAFVYLVPAVILFSIGQVPALVATIIYATPPVVRLTNHGIRQVREDAVEAAEAFGSTKRQTLLKIQLPLAFPTIMAGINQTVMMALAMVVIASLVGASGLGGVVLTGLQNLNVGLAFVGGLGIVILAMIIDRITQAAGRGGEEGAPA